MRRLVCVVLGRECSLVRVCVVALPVVLSSSSSSRRMAGEKLRVAHHNVLCSSVVEPRAAPPLIISVGPGTTINLDSSTSNSRVPLWYAGFTLAAE